MRCDAMHHHNSICYSNKVTLYRSKQRALRMHWPKRKWNKNSGSIAEQHKEYEHQKKMCAAMVEKQQTSAPAPAIQHHRHHHPFEVILKTADNSNADRKNLFIFESVCSFCICLGAYAWSWAAIVAVTITVTIVTIECTSAMLRPDRSVCHVSHCGPLWWFDLTRKLRNHLVIVCLFNWFWQFDGRLLDFDFNFFPFLQ